jgi:PAS domain S-box-containing protein
MTEKLNVLLIEDSEDDELLLTRELNKGPYKPLVQRVETEEDMEHALNEKKWDVVISDYVLPKFSGLHALQTLQKSKQDLPFIIVSGKIGEYDAVEAMKAGAHDYIMKNNLIRLNEAIKRELADAQARHDKKKAEQQLQESYKKLEKINAQLEKEIDNRKEAEKQIYTIKEHLQNVIDSASEIVISIDNNYRITTWNTSIQQITGFKYDEVTNRTITKLPLFDEPQKLKDLIKNVEKKPVKNEELILLTKQNTKKIIQITGTTIKGKYGHKSGFLLIGKDITRDIEIHGKLIKGSSYLIAHEHNNVALEIFTDLASQYYNGLYITRTNPYLLQHMRNPSKNIQFAFFSENKYESHPQIATLEDLIKTIQEFSRTQEKPLILIDRADYLKTQYSFKDLMRTLYKINDLVIKHKAILLYRIDPTILTNQELAQINNELYSLPSQRVEGIILKDDLFKILRYIFEENEKNSLVPVKKIISQFRIAFSTAANRIEELESKGLIFSKKQGKLKTLFATEKGKTLLHKRDIL